MSLSRPKERIVAYFSGTQEVPHVQRDLLMVWFRLDDSFADHPKVLAAGNTAIGLWARCGAYASKHLTDGYIPGTVALMYGTAADVEHLIIAGLWEPRDAGFQMHDFTEYNPPREKTEAERRRHADNQRSYVESRKNREILPLADLSPDRSVIVSRPDPTVSSIEETLTGSRRSPERPLPEDWMPTASHRALASQRGVSLEWQADRFRDHAATNDRRCRNWNMAFTSWLKQSDPARDRGVKAGKPVPAIDRSTPFQYPEGWGV